MNRTVGGALLLGDAILALVWANSPWSSGYQDLVLRARNRYYRQLCAAEAVDADADGIPDVWDDDSIRR